MKVEVDDVACIPTSLNGDFFKSWFRFLLPFHHLTEREMDVAAAFTKKRYELSKVISDDKLLDTVLMNEDSKREIRDECGITLPHFQVIMGKLRKAKVITEDNMLNSRYIPNIKDTRDNFRLLLLFDYHEPENIPESSE